MSDTNGRATIIFHPDRKDGGAGAGARTSREDRRAQLRELRTSNRLLAESIRAKRLARTEQIEERRRRLTETLALDWVTPYTDLLARLRSNGDPAFTGPSSYWQRRQGKYYPIFQTEAELNLLRAPARVLCATNSYAIGMLEGLVSYVIGPGFDYRAAKKNKESDFPDEGVKACQAVIDKFLDDNDWHGGEQPALSEENFLRSCRDGEYLNILTARDDGGTDVRTVEPEQLTQKPDGDWREWLFGIRTPPEDVQKHEAYWIQWGDSPADGEEYSADEVIHVRRNVDRGIKRGLTDFSFDTLDALELAGRLRTNMGDAAAQQAAIVGVRQHDSGSKEDIQGFVDGDGEWTESDPLTGTQVDTRRYRRGLWEDIPKGLNYVPGPIAQSQPIHLQVLQGLLRSAGVRWNAPEWLPSADASNNNYSSSLTAESPFVRTVIRRQRTYKSADQKMLWKVLRNYHDRRGIWAGGRRLDWEEIERELDIIAEPKSPEVRNKLQEAQQAAIEIPLGVDSRQRYTQSQGRDWEQVQADNEQYMAETGGGGMQLPLPGEGGGGMGGGGGGLGGGGLGGALGESLDLLESGAECVTEDRYHQLTEAGRVGLVRKEIVNKAGRKQVVWVRGTPDAPKGKPAAKERPTVDQTAAHVAALRENFTTQGLLDLATALHGHTVAELKELKARLGIKASGPKAELAKKIAERALQASAAGAETPAAKPAPKAKPAAKPAPAVPEVSPDAIRDAYNRAGSTAMSSELNAAMRSAAAMPKKDAAALLATMGFRGKAADPNRELVDMIYDRWGARRRATIIGDDKAAMDRERARLAQYEDEPLLSPDKVLPKEKPAAASAAASRPLPATFTPKAKAAAPSRADFHPAAQAAHDLYHRATSATDAEIDAAMKEFAKLPAAEKVKAAASIGVRTTAANAAKEIRTAIEHRRGSLQRAGMLEPQRASAHEKTATRIKDMLDYARTEGDPTPAERESLLSHLGSLPLDELKAAAKAAGVSGDTKKAVLQRITHLLTAGERVRNQTAH